MPVRWGPRSLCCTLLCFFLLVPSKLTRAFNIEVVTLGGEVKYSWSDSNSAENGMSSGIYNDRLLGELLYPLPKSACTTVVNPVKRNDTLMAFAFFDDYMNTSECSAFQREIDIFRSTFDAMIAATQAYNVMQLDVSTTLPQALVPEDVGSNLKSLALNSNGTMFVRMWDDSFLIYQRLFIIFGSVLLAAVAVSVVIFCCSICWRSAVIKWRTRGLTRWQVRRLPKRKYRKGREASQSCSICLDDFEEGESIRVLPCEHIFHPSCVDEWLRKWNRVCPNCKSSIKRREGGGDKRAGGAGPDREERAPLLTREEEASTRDLYGSTDNNPSSPLASPAPAVNVQGVGAGETNRRGLEFEEEAEIRVSFDEEVEEVRTTTNQQSSPSQPGNSVVAT